MFSKKPKDWIRKHKKNTLNNLDYRNIAKKKTASIDNIDKLVDSILAKVKINSFEKYENVKTVIRIGKRLSAKKLLSIALSFTLLFAVIASASSLVDPELVGTSADIGGSIGDSLSSNTNISEHNLSDDVLDNSTFSNDQNGTDVDGNESVINESIHPVDDVNGNETSNKSIVPSRLNLSLQSDKDVYIVNETVFIAGRILYNDLLVNASVSLLIIGPGIHWSEVLDTTNKEFSYEFAPAIIGNYSIHGNVLFENESAEKIIVFNVIDLPFNDSDDVTSDDQKIPDVVDEAGIYGTPFTVFEAPDNSFGPSSLKIINMDYFWEYFNRYSGWYLDAWDSDSSTWLDVTEYLNIIRNRSVDNQFEKVSLEFTAPLTADYRLTYIIDRPVKKFSNLSDQYEYQLTFPVGNNEEYTTFFNFSDIASLPDVTLNHGVDNINGADKFWFSVQRNNIPAGTNVILDPTFGNTSTSFNNRDGDDIPGGYFQMGSVGGTADSITAYFSTAGGANSGRAAIYDSGGNLLTNGVSDENSAVQDGWVTFTYSTSPTLQADAWYYLVVFTDDPKSDLQYALSGGNGLYVDTGETYPNFPDPYAATSIDADAVVSIYCTYTEWDDDPPTPDPLTWFTDPYNVSSSNITMIATTASDSTTPIEYFFNETTGNSGGTDSGWQQSTTYSDDGLSENMQYGYEVKARDDNTTPNEGNYSTPIFYEYTSVDPPTDGELTFEIGTTWLNATVAQPPNPTSGSTGSNFSWTTGGANYSDWQNGIYYHNRSSLTENTNYGCQVQYRNGDANATSFNPTEKTNYTLCEPPADGEFTIDSNGRTWINVSVLDVDNNPTAGSTAAYFECVTGGVSDSGWVTASSSGRYYYNITGLNSDTTYGFRVKYRNADAEETTYTSEKQQATDLPIVPTVTTNATIGVEETNATLNGWLQDNGSADTTCYFLLNDTNDFGSPIFNLSKGIIANGDEFENNTAGETTLTQGKLYYYKVQANNSAGWAEGSVQMFLTKPDNISSFTATLYGTTQINLTWTDETGGDGAYIEYAKNAPPSPWNEGDGTPTDADGNVTSPFSHSSLDAGTRYYYKAWAYATDSGWTSSGNQSAPRGNPKTADETTTGTPSVVTNDTTGIEETNATLEGWLQSNGTLDTTCYFLWGTQNPPTDNNVSQGIIANGDGFSYDTSGTGALTKGTPYYVDTKANNSGGWNESGGVKAFLTKPDPPSSLIAQMNSSSVIYLTWTTGAGYNTTYIERNASGQTVWARGEGIMIYNGSGTNYEDTGLAENVTYYYQAWSYANWTYDSTTLYQWSDNNDSSNNKTNSLPTITNEIPANESTGVSVPTQLSITVNDFEGGSMTITWYSNSSGIWQPFGTNVTGADGNGTYYQTNDNFSNYSKTYYWNVSVNDGKDTNNSDKFHFSTESLVTSVDPIIPYIVTSSPKTITATGDSALDQVSLYYRWAEDNQSWDSWDLLTYDDFEDGFGNYTDGGADCELYTGVTYAHQGSNAANIQDNSGVASSFYHTTGIDVDTPGYECIQVEFWFQSIGLDNGHEFYVEYFDGTIWQQPAIYVAGTEFVNGEFYHEIVWINETGYTFPTDMQIRFQCNALNVNDDVYIDEVRVVATTQSTGGNGRDWTLWSGASNPDTSYDWSWDFDFPEESGYYEFYSIGNKSGSGDESAPGSADASCRLNFLPIISNETPLNQSTNIQLIPQLNITIIDIENETLNITWYSNSSSSWQIFGTNNSVKNGTYYQTNTNFSDPGETYWWNVSVYDGIHTNTTTYYFTTSYEPVFSNPGPSNESTAQYTTPVCNVTVSDQDGGTVTVQFYENTTGPWIIQQTNSSVDVTTPTNVVWDNYNNASQDFTTYWWKVNVTDEKGNFIEEIYNFRTANVTIETTPALWNQGLVSMGGSNETTGFYFNLTNQGDAPLFIQINATNATNSTTGALWRLNATPDFDNFTLQYNKSGVGTWTNINLTYDTFVTSLAVGSWQTFDLKLLMAPKATYGHPLTVTITFRSVIS